MPPSDTGAVTMGLFLKIMGILVMILVLLLTFRYCVQKPTVVTVTEEVLVIDSVAVKALNQEIGVLRNMLGAKPKTITITKTLHDTVAVTDTIAVYPIGSKAIRRDYPFKAIAGKDSLSLVVNTDLYAYVYADDQQSFYYEDSLRVWLTDINIHKHNVIPITKPKATWYIMGGVGIAKYQQNASGITITQTDIQPNLGIGYMRDIVGAYLLGAPNGASAGISINIPQLIKDVFK